MLTDRLLQLDGVCCQITEVVDLFEVSRTCITRNYDANEEEGHPSLWHTAAMTRRYWLPCTAENIMQEDV